MPDAHLPFRFWIFRRLTPARFSSTSVALLLTMLRSSEAPVDWIFGLLMRTCFVKVTMMKKKEKMKMKKKKKT
ncbi:hypothetical protein A2U01_0039329, partial [Trifolium medium]|nr:hypothetical protein [Trifolium medium]